MRDYTKHPLVYRETREEVRDGRLDFRHYTVILAVGLGIAMFFDEMTDMASLPQPQSGEFLKIVPDAPDPQVERPAVVEVPELEVPPNPVVVDGFRRLSQVRSMRNVDEAEQVLVALLEELTEDSPPELVIEALLAAGQFYQFERDVAPDIVESFYQRALAEMTRSLPANDVRFLDVHGYLERFYEWQERWDDAVAQVRLQANFHEAHTERQQRDANIGMGYFRTGMYYRKAGRRDEAMAALLEARRLILAAGQDPRMIQGQIDRLQNAPVIDVDAIRAIEVRGLELASVEKRGSQIFVTGVADNNQAVSRFMRQVGTLGARPNLRSLTREGETVTFDVSIEVGG